MYYYILAIRIRFEKFKFKNSSTNFSQFGPAVAPAIADIYTGWFKKSVICGAWCKIVPFLCNSSLWCFFNISWNSFIFLIFKKNGESFFLSKLKVQKAFLHINYFYRNLKKFQDWIKESQKIRKIVKRKFPIFSSGLSFNEKLFKFSSSFLLCIMYILKFSICAV